MAGARRHRRESAAPSGWPMVPPRGGRPRAIRPQPVASAPSSHRMGLGDVRRRRRRRTRHGLRQRRGLRRRHGRTGDRLGRRRRHGRRDGRARHGLGSGRAAAQLGGVSVPSEPLLPGALDSKRSRSGLGSADELRRARTDRLRRPARAGALRRAADGLPGRRRRDPGRRRDRTNRLRLARHGQRHTRLPRERRLRHADVLGRHARAAPRPGARREHRTRLDRGGRRGSALRSRRLPAQPLPGSRPPGGVRAPARVGLRGTPAADPRRGGPAARYGRPDRARAGDGRRRGLHRRRAPRAATGQGRTLCPRNARRRRLRTGGPGDRRRSPPVRPRAARPGPVQAVRLGARPAGVAARALRARVARDRDRDEHPDRRLRRRAHGSLAGWAEAVLTPGHRRGAGPVRTALLRRPRCAAGSARDREPTLARRPRSRDRGAQRGHPPSSSPASRASRRAPASSPPPSSACPPLSSRSASRST